MSDYSRRQFLARMAGLATGVVVAKAANALPVVTEPRALIDDLCAEDPGEPLSMENLEKAIAGLRRNLGRFDVEYRGMFMSARQCGKTHALHQELKRMMNETGPIPIVSNPRRPSWVYTLKDVEWPVSVECVWDKRK